LQLLAMSNGSTPELYSLVGEIVVLDLSSPYVIIGRLTSLQADYLVLDRVDCHDLRDSPTTREKYVLNCREHGARPNRNRTWVSRREVIAISRLDDVLLD
jgi:hypothetical protein